MATNDSVLATFFDFQGRQFAEKCIRCGLCLDVCPVFPLMKAARLGSTGVIEKLVQVTCSGTWPLFTSVPFQAHEMVQFLLDNLDQIPFRYKVNRAVTLHDSCQVARIGATDQPRQLLQAVPGITLVEMAHNRSDALCCGGYTNTIHPEISESMRRAPLNEACDARAKVLATICGRCQQSLAPLEDQYPIKVENFISILAEAIGVKREDPFKKLFRTRDVSTTLAESSDNIKANGLSIEEAERVLPDYVRRFCI